MSAAATEDPGTIPIEEVERELTRQLREGQTDKIAIRARMSNLVIFTDDEAAARSIANDVPEIVVIHPARVLLVVLAPEREYGGVAATVSAWCHRGSDGERICSEQVTIRSRGPDLARVNSVILGLVIGDLPTNVWWASTQPVPFAGHSFLELAEHVQQVIYDSNGWAEPAKAIAVTANWLSRFERGPNSKEGPWRVASDLNWRRLKGWRRLLSQALDPGSAPGVLPSITEVLVEHGPHAVAQAVELVGWIASRLGWKVAGGKVRPGVDVAWQFSSPHGPVQVCLRRLAEGPSEVRGLRLACLINRRPGALWVRYDDAGRLSAQPEGVPVAPRTLIVQPTPLPELVGRQLSDRERDPVFAESMAVAQTLVKCLLER